MNQIVFIIIILVILVLFKLYRLDEKFESVNLNQYQQENKDTGIYNTFYQQVMNPYQYPMTPFFSNDSQEPPKPSPDYPKY
jgi:hypothetical protein